jgi:hypothetical protein
MENVDNNVKSVYRGLVGDLKGKEHLDDLDIGVSAVLQYIFNQ